MLRADFAQGGVWSERDSKMPRNLQEYAGRTIYSAAHLAGLELEPVRGHSPASIVGNKLWFDPFLPLPEQRAQIVRVVATRLALRGSAGSVTENMRALDDALLQA